MTNRATQRLASLLQTSGLLSVTSRQPSHQVLRPTLIRPFFTMGSSDSKTIDNSSENFKNIKRVKKTEQEWKSVLTKEEFYVCRKAGTERAFTGKYHDCKTKGTYVCTCCDHPLFSSSTKFNSGTGWPSYFAPYADDSIKTKADYSFGKRIEVLCAKCDSHLGHVFDDGPMPTGKRFCINSVSLKLRAE